MQQPIDLYDPPHLQFRLISRGALFIALHGAMAREAFQARLGRPDALQLLHLHRPVAAMIDVANVPTLSAAELEFVTGWYFHQLASAGCARVGLVLPAAQLAALGPIAVELSRRNTPSVQLELFDRQEPAVQWVQAVATAPPGATPAPPRPPVAAMAPAMPPGAGAAPGYGPSVAAVPGVYPPPGGSLAVPVAGLVAAAPPVVAPPPVAPPPVAPPPPAVEPVVASTAPAPRLLPRLQPAGWALAAQAVCRPLAQSGARGVPADKLPLVALVLDAPPRRYTALRDGEPVTDLEGWVADAIANLDEATLPLEGRNVGPAGVPRMVRCLDPFAAELLLSSKQLERARELLQADVMAVAAPVRGMFLAAALPGNAQVLEGLFSTARQSFDEGGERALSPEVFRVERGAVVGLVPLPPGLRPPEPPPPPPPPPPPAEPQILVARTVAEANLYMDLRGAEPGSRNHKLVPHGNDLVSTYECKVEGESALQRFAFLIEDVAAPPGVLGGPAPSQIVSPEQFLTWADILAKRIPAQPEGLTPEQRRRCRLDLQFAAACLDEVIKFIPDGGDAVPAELFRTPASQKKYQQEPGRFRRGRLDAVAQTYRRLAEQF